MGTFRGHTNEKNFVGLSVNSEYMACGSETNEVFVYHKVGKQFYQPVLSLAVKLLHNYFFLIFPQAISKPAARHGFSSYENTAEDNGGSYFTSAVCWKSDSPTILAANSQGNIKVLVLAA